MKTEKKRIVVLGGSFNPPTLAHYKLMKKAIDALDADIGFFVPVSDAYLKRKMRNSHPPVVLSEEMRVKMLQAMSIDGRMQVSKLELGIIAPSTVPTMMAIQEANPGAELYFVMGDDKLKLLHHLTENRDFLKTFKVVLYSREDMSIMETLKNDELLLPYLDRIVILQPPEGVEAISSSKVRERMLAGESSEDLLCTGVWDLFKELKAKDFPDVINRFKDDYYFLSNSFNCRIIWQRLRYGSAEAAFQSSKCEDESERKVYAGCSVQKAVLKGKDQIPYRGWEDGQLEIMESILQAKFEQNAALMTKLRETGTCVLIHGNNKHDTFWGVDLYSWQGENHLGKILMKIRDKE